MSTTMDINEAKQHLAQLLNLAKSGTEVFIAEDNLPVARLTAIAPVSSFTRRVLPGYMPAQFA